MTAQPDIADIKKQRELAEEQLRLFHVQRLQRAYGMPSGQRWGEPVKQPTRLQEGSADIGWDWLEPWTDLFDRYQNSQFIFAPMTTLNDRRLGKDFPFFQNEQQLQILRAPSRVLAGMNAYAIGLLRGLGAYTMGTGFTYRAGPKDQAKRVPLGSDDLVKSSGAELADAAQDVLDEFTDPLGELCWPLLQLELFERSEVDGEYFLRLGRDTDGSTWVRTMEPEQIRQHPERGPEWFFGILTEPDDVWRRRAYWVADMLNPANGEELPAADVIHFKINTVRSVKRGLPSFTWSTYDALIAADKLRRNTSDGAAIQAAIAAIRQHEGYSAAQVEAFQQSRADDSLTDPISGISQSVQHVGTGGNVLDLPNGTVYVPPPGASNAEAYIAVTHLCLRGACVRWNAPEWLATSSGEAMAAYTASLVAESPFVKGVLQTQQRHSIPHLILMKRRLRDAIDQSLIRGASARDLFRLVQLTAQCPTVEARNKLEEAQANQIRVMGDWKSRRQVAGEEGIDYEQAERDNQEYRDRFGSQGPALPMPDENGEMPPEKKPPEKKPA